MTMIMETAFSSHVMFNTEIYGFQQKCSICEKSWQMLKFRANTKIYGFRELVILVQP